MAEKVFEYSLSEEKTIEKIMEDENIAVNHMILPEGASLPLHDSDSNVYMIVVRGVVSVILNQGNQHDYAEGKILYIPYRTHMNISNRNHRTAEIFVVKSPPPGKMACMNY